MIHPELKKLLKDVGFSKLAHFEHCLIADRMFPPRGMRKDRWDELASQIALVLEKCECIAKCENAACGYVLRHEIDTSGLTKHEHLLEAKQFMAEAITYDNDNPPQIFQHDRTASYTDYSLPLEAAQEIVGLIRDFWSGVHKVRSRYSAPEYKDVKKYKLSMVLALLATEFEEGK